MATLSSQGQSISRKKAKALNAYAELASLCVEKLTGSLSCLAQFSEASQAYRLKPEEEFIGKGQVCVLPLKASRLQQTTALSAALSAEEKKQIEPAYTAMLAAYEQIVQKSNALELYVQLQEYRQDQQQEQAQQLLQEIQHAWQLFRKQKRLMDERIYAIYRSHQPIQENNRLDNTAEKMRKAWLQEVALMDQWQYNLRPEIRQGGMPVAALTENMHAVESMFRQEQNASGSLPYRQFLLKLYYDLQKTKGYRLDRNFGENLENDQHSNKAYSALLGQLKDLHAYFKQHCTQQDGFTGVAPSAYCPVFILPVSSIAPKALPPKQYRPETIAQLVPEASEKALTAEATVALNSYTALVNEMVAVLKKLPAVCQSYNRRLNASYTQDFSFPRIRYQFNRVPLSYYKQARFQSQYLPEAYRKPLNARTEQLWQLFEELRFLMGALEQQTYGKRDAPPGYPEVYQSLNRLAYLIMEFHRQTDRLYADIKTVYQTYQAEQAAPWDQFNALLAPLAAESHALLNQTRLYLTESANSLPEKNSLRQKIKKAYQYKAAFLEETARHNYGNATHKISGYYISLLKSAQKIAELLEQKQNERYAQKADRFYVDLLYEHNRMLRMAYNPLVEVPDLSLPRSEFLNPHLDYPPAFLLAEQHLLDVYRFVPPAGGILTEQEARQKEIDELYTSMEGYAHNHLVLLLDVSSSMRSPDKLPLLKQSLRRLLGIMRKEDKLTVVLYSEDAKAVLKAASCTSRKVMRTIDKLQSGGGTHIEEGISLAYQMAEKYYIDEGNNRIILATDGQFALRPSVTEQIQQKGAKNIALSVFYYGGKQQLPEKLKLLAEKGSGTFAHITTDNTDLMLAREAKAKRME